MEPKALALGIKDLAIPFAIDSLRFREAFRDRLSPWALANSLFYIDPDKHRCGFLRGKGDRKSGCLSVPEVLSKRAFSEA